MKADAIMLNKQAPEQSGLVIILFVVVLPILLGVMAIALDTGKLFIVKTELQNAADACALSAGQELDGTSAQFNRAQEAGRLAGVSHKVNLQKVAVAFPNNSAVTFAQNLNDGAGSYITAATGAGLSNANSANYRYVKCSVSSTTSKLLNVPGLANNDTISAQAIASRVPTQSPCVLPIGVCSNANAITTNTKGAWISGEIGKNDPCVGNANCYKWVVYNGATPNASNLANLLTGNNTCGISITSQSVTEFSGAAVSPYDEYNTRFGVQKNADPTNNPDFTGYGYTPASFPAANNAYNDYISRRTALTKYQGSFPGYNKIIQPTPSNATSRRIGVVPIIPCTGGTSTVNNYACVLMLNPIASAGGNKTLYLEYLGTSNTGACTQAGYAGGAGAGPTVSALVQ